MQLSLPLVGSILSERYHLERVLGEGASSVVFAARDLRLDREVAVKVLKPQVVTQAAEQRARFLSEARTLARLAHSHIVPVFDVCETAEGVAYLVLELVSDQTLAKELEARGTLGIEDALGLLLPLMGALALAHDRGVVHRDLKPANVVLESRGPSGMRAKLLDFGIAKHEGGNTSSGLALGTPGYMAPEQASSGKVGPASDVWAMGVIFFRCLTGRLPFDAPNATGVLLKVVNERAPHFAEVCPELGRHVSVALDQALEPDVAARLQGMREFARRLAIACKQDGLRLPVDPDPVGLPQFGAWLAEADVETTARGACVDERTPLPAGLPLASAAPRLSGRRRRLLGACVALLGSGAVALALGGAQEGPVREARAEEAEATLELPVAEEALALPVRALEHGLEPDDLVSTDEPQKRSETAGLAAPSAADAGSPEAESSQPPKLAPPPRRSASHARRPRVSATQASQALPGRLPKTEQAPSAEAPAPTNLVKQWDW